MNHFQLRNPPRPPPVADTTDQTNIGPAGIFPARVKRANGTLT
jgi:hypothetical protein